MLCERADPLSPRSPTPSLSLQDMAEAVVVSDLVAPEHLEIQTEDAQKVADR